MSDLPRRRFATHHRARLAFGGLAVASLTLSGCEDPPAEPLRFSSVEQCVSAGYERPFCQSTQSAALAEHERSAPQYSNAAQCEAEWGDNGCQRASSGGSMFTPLLAGFLVGRALSGGNSYYGGSGYYGSPIYRSRGGQAVTAVPGRDGIAATRMAPVNVGTTTVARSGFGGRGMSRGGGGWGG
nr:DUF1190 domain-containing protein [Croceibacterium mercuriale]